MSITSKTKKTTVAGLAAIGLFIALTAESCEGDDSADKATKDTQNSQQAQTIDAFKKQSAAVPYPKDQLSNPQERHNLRERLLRQNDPNRISYLYVLSYAQPLGYYVIKGKVSSTQSQMTSSDFELDHGSYGQSVIEAPSDDGSYGPNEDGIFFFTAAGVMVQTDLNYVVSDQPIPFGKLDVPKLG